MSVTSFDSELQLSLDVGKMLKHLFTHAVISPSTPFSQLWGFVKSTELSATFLSFQRAIAIVFLPLMTFGETGGCCLGPLPKQMHHVLPTLLPLNKVV